jgi:hypothetical protein
MPSVEIVERKLRVRMTFPPVSRLSHRMLPAFPVNSHRAAQPAKTGVNALMCPRRRP